MNLVVYPGYAPSILKKTNSAGPFQLTCLVVLSFPSNDLTGSLPPNMDLPDLEWLELNNNKLTGLLPPSISNCSKFDILEISYNSFIGKLTIDFAKLRDLRLLFLIGNDFGRGREVDDMKFIDSLKNCSILTALGLTECNFHGMVPKSIGNLSHQLVRLRLGGNQFYGNIPSSIGNLVGLKYLSLDTNRFSGSIPSTIGMLQQLGFAALDENHFSGPIPEAIGNLSLLITLRLGSNRLEGHIPTSLGNCQKLSELHLYENKLSGIIPKQLLRLPSLPITFNLSNNNLSGSLPIEAGDLKMLTALDISYNNISGNIPNGLAGCTSLTFLSLKGNLLQGKISLSLRSLRGLEVLDISQNNLSGRIPEFLESLPLKFMNLSFNDFEGDVPVVGVFSNASAFSILGNSRLCGGLVELRLPRCKETKKHDRRFYLFIIVILVSLMLIGIVCFAYVWRKKKKNKELSQTSKNEGFLKAWVPKWYGRREGSFHATLFTIKVSYNQLYKATDGFSEANLIGKGGFSSVYKGILEYDNFIAVKVLHLLIRGAHKSFIAECEAWRNIRHRNLLKIITSCSSVDFQGNDFKALVYEYMPNGSLHDWLHSSASTSRLSLIQRVNILIDVASALDYLHNQCLTSIAHGDLKPSNILLDNDMVAHVGDFGLARFLGTSSSQHSSTGVKGTIGYAPPEYGLGNEITSSGDVYSFGILLLEVMTGKKPTDDIFNEGLSLHKFVCAALPNHVLDVIDESAIVMQSTTKANAQKVDECSSSIFKIGELDECLASILKIGVSCSVYAPSRRMNIKIVVQELVHILDIIKSLSGLSPTFRGKLKIEN